MQVGRDKIIKHYKKANWIYCVALILDPRHKLEAFDLKEWSKEFKDQSNQKFRDLLRNEYSKLETDSSQEVAASTNTKGDDGDKEDEDDFSIDFDTFYVKAPKNNNESWEFEINNYLNSPRSNASTNILSWWKNNEEIYPRISKIAKNILAIMATLVPVERMFSEAGLIFTDKRSSLGNEPARALLSINM